MEAELVVLGAGPGGYTAAFRAADLGKKVVLVERAPVLGGVCLNVGCIPSKALLHAAKVLEEAHEMVPAGLGFSRPPIDLDKLRQWKEGVVGRLTGGLTKLAQMRGVTVVQGTGRFVSPSEMEVSDERGGVTRLAFGQAIIAAGSEPATLPREAAAAFADDRVLIEKYLTRPRHIEVQVFADKHGNAVHLFERDCSLQRRHQKVIEEAPAPGIDERTRKAVCEAAVNAAKAINYEGAGTVEFIADASEGLRPDRIFFMEMNTRLQVEHPVTEAITGQDLVEWQIRVASGEPLPLRQEDLKINGHAVEARLYAENPQAGFLPSTGPLRRFRMPEGIRVDSGFREGDEVSPYYDPMLAKVVAHGPTRQAAASKLARACAAIEVWPVKTNASFLARALSDEAFLKGDIDTAFIPQRIDMLLAPATADEDVLQAAAAARVEPPGSDPWSGAQGFRVNRAPKIELEVQEGDVRHLIVLDQKTATPPAIRDRDTVVVFKGGHAYSFSPPRHDAVAGSEKGGSTIAAPMPGRVIAVLVEEGESVVQGQTILKLEAMKMEHALIAVLAGKVQALSASVGELVSEGTVLASIAPEH